MQLALVVIILAVCAVFIAYRLRRLTKGETCDCGQCEGCPLQQKNRANCKKECCKEKK